MPSIKHPIVGAILWSLWRSWSRYNSQLHNIVDIIIITRIASIIRNVDLLRCPSSSKCFKLFYQYRIVRVLFSNNNRMKRKRSTHFSNFVFSYFRQWRMRYCNAFQSQDLLIIIIAFFLLRPFYVTGVCLRLLELINLKLKLDREKYNVRKFVLLMRKKKWKRKRKKERERKKLISSLICYFN